MFGRKCSFWCIKNGYIASASLVITVLPTEIQNAGAIACKDYIRSISDASLNGECEEYLHSHIQIFYRNEARGYYSYADERKEQGGKEWPR